MFSNRSDGKLALHTRQRFQWVLIAAYILSSSEKLLNKQIIDCNRGTPFHVRASEKHAYAYLCATQGTWDGQPVVMCLILVVVSKCDWLTFFEATRNSTIDCDWWLILVYDAWSSARNEFDYLEAHNQIVCEKYGNLIFELFMRCKFPSEKNGSSGFRRLLLWKGMCFAREKLISISMTFPGFRNFKKVPSNANL